jgi:O-antigen/teichoic acid export membrane protein
MADTDGLRHAGEEAGAAAVPLPSFGDPTARMRGLTAGAIVFGGVAFANLANAAFNIIAGRRLGPGRYGDLAALLAALGLVSFPLGAAQYNIASWVAALAARRDAQGISALYRRAMSAALVFGGLAAGVFTVASPAIRDALGVSETMAVVLMGLAAFPAAFTPVVLGLAQGLERFVLFAWAQTAMPVMRVILLPFALALGLGVAGAMGATLVAAVIGFLVPAFLLRRWFVRAPGPSPITRAPAVRAISPVTLGIISLTALTSVDVVVAKIAFHGDLAGVYGGASLIGRLILYVPAAIVAVLLPKVSSRTAIGQRSSDIVVKSLLTTAALCLAATAVYALVPRTLLVLAYGSKYTEATSFLWLFGLSMTGFALVNVVFVYHIARRSTLVPMILAGAALVQLGLFAAVHGSPRQLLTISIVVGYSLLATLIAVTWRQANVELVSLFRE